ncbi:MAG: sensor histidine kinase [Schwartzia sp.]|nr:sensor histidine kinase [Schwartzia sp. (in: firmicutes)]
MPLAIGMAVGLTLIQAIGAYLRYLPFEAGLAPEARARLRKYILLWMPVSCVLYQAYFLHAGVGVETFKRIQYVGWIPFFGFSLLVIRNEGMRHTFVLGMQTLWFALLHTASGTLILTLLPPHYGAGSDRLPVQTALYIVFFLLLLPMERRIFRNLLPPTLFAGNSLAGWCFAILPLGLCASPLITLIERPLMYTWTDRISRFFLLFWGFSLYQYALYAGKRAADIREERHTNELLTQQLHALESQALLLEARADDVRRVRHDLRHYNRLLASLLDSGDVAAARKLIEEQDKDLLARPISAYCKSPVVNAALTVYVQMAAKEGIRVSCGANLDASGGSRRSDGDLAILLSNVIENAIIASRRQPEGRREIAVSLACDGTQYALAVKNRFDAPVRVGDDGLPAASEHGHGTGMASLRNFSKKYGAEVIFTQADGWVKLLMYWSGAGARASDGPD